jgi:hypothetical protein
MKLPTIQSVGAPPEEHADRIVAEMLHLLVRGRLAYERHIKAAIYLPDGNPRAQAKLAGRLRQSGWPFILSADLIQAGKRGRYVLSFATLDGWSPSRQRIIADEGDIPQKPWLAVSLTA